MSAPDACSPDGADGVTNGTSYIQYIHRTCVSEGFGCSCSFVLEAAHMLPYLFLNSLFPITDCCAGAE